MNAAAYRRLALDQQRRARLRARLALASARAAQEAQEAAAQAREPCSCLRCSLQRAMATAAEMQREDEAAVHVVVPAGARH